MAIRESDKPDIRLILFPGSISLERLVSKIKRNEQNYSDFSSIRKREMSMSHKKLFHEREVIIPFLSKQRVIFGHIHSLFLTVIIKANGPPAIIIQKPEIMMNVKMPRITQFFHL